MLGAQLISPGYAISFNCDHTSTCTEEVICQTPQLSRLDSIMADRYFQLQDQSTRGAARVLLDSRWEWLDSRDSCGCNANCLVQHYKARIRMFREVLGLD